jgi:Fe-S-cluster containining protein
VDPRIFEHRYFGACLHCGFCGDACCDHGVDVALVERDRILAHAPLLEPLVGTPSSSWFRPDVTDDPDFPGGQATRTAVVDGSCVFRQRGARGCALHAFALQRGADYHDVKPMVSSLFPVTFGDGALLCSDELADGSLVCAGTGPTAYEMARAELAYYFGAALVAELDALAAVAAGTDGLRADRLERQRDADDADRADHGDRPA